MSDRPIIGLPALVQSAISTHLQRFVGIVNHVADGLPGLVLTSWYRDTFANAEAGGGEFSQHLAGLAVDVAGPPEILEALAWGVGRMELVPVPEVGHLHVQAYPAGTISPQFLEWAGRAGLPLAI